MAEQYRSQDVELQREPAYFAIIPASVRYDPELRASAKLLFGELTALCDKTGYCWASNRYFAELYHLSDKTVSELMLQLERRGHILRDVVRNDRNEVVQRRIYVGKTPAIPSPEKSGEGYTEKSGDPPPKNPADNNTRVNNTSNPPKAPQKRRRGEPKRAPDWNPERFAAFWDFYPRGESKQAAIAAWDKLKPSDDLIDTMARALKRQKATEDWQHGIGIPYASTYLNQRRWEDEQKRPVPPPDEGEEAYEAWN